MHRSNARRRGWLPAAAGGLAVAVAAGGMAMAVQGPALAAPVTTGVAAAGVGGVAAGNAAIASVDLSGTWTFPFYSTCWAAWAWLTLGVMVVGTIIRLMAAPG